MKLKNIVLSLSLLSNIALSSTGSELNHFFDNLGFSSNATSAKAYSTQAAGFLSGGSFYMRSQVRNIQIAHVDVPGFRSGCGGIDLIAGGFSFITTDQITQFMQSILSSGAGYALNLALETELPEVAHSLQQMQNMANMINGSNLNSCEAGELAAAAFYPKNRAASQRVCEDLGLKGGAFADWAAARHQCSTGGAIEEQLEKAKKDPEYKDRSLYDKNVVWDALQENQFLKADNELAQAYMSISGTVIFDKKGSISSYPSLVNNRDFIKATLYGGKLPVYRCTDQGAQSKCVQVSYSEDTYQTISQSNALVNQVEELMLGIYTNIKNGTALSEKQRGLINMSQDNVFSLIAANAQQGIGLQGSHALAQSVAADMLSQYLSNALGIIRSSLAGKNSGAGNEDRLIANLREAQKYVDTFSKEARAKFNQSLQTNLLIQQNVRQAYSALSPLLQTAYKGGTTS